MADYDVITIGAGPNGLMTSALLQVGGKKVCCCELNNHVGGLASNVYGELGPGFVHNRGAWYLMFAQIESLIDKLQLEKYGFELLDPKHNAVILPNNPPDPAVRLFQDSRETIEDMGKRFGKDTADRFVAFLKYLEPFSIGTQYAISNAPIPVSQIIDTMPNHEAQQAMTRLFYGTAMELIDEFFPDKKKHAPLRAYFSFYSIDGFYGGPMTPGSALTMAYHFGTPTEGEGATGAQFRVPKGHMGNFSETIAKSFEANGGILKKNAEVKKILVKNNKAYGVKLADGTEITADIIISSCDAYNTFINMVGTENTPSWLVDAIKQINYTETLNQTYLTLNKLPEFRKEYDDLNHDDWRFHLLFLGDAELYEENWNAIKFGKLPPRVGGGMYIPSMLDPSLAPEGKHTATWCDLNVWPKDVPDNKIDEVKNDLFNKKCDFIERFMPDFRDCIQDWKMMCSKDYNKLYHVTGGTWTHEMIEIKQMFDMRPVKGMSDCRAPIKNMYLCGSSNHPGPGINGRTPMICINSMTEDGVI